MQKHVKFLVAFLMISGAITLALADGWTYGWYYRVDRPGMKYSIYGETMNYAPPMQGWLRARTRIYAHFPETTPPKFEKLIGITRIWTGCPYTLTDSRVGTKTNTHDTDNFSILPWSGYSYEVTKHKLVDSRTTKGDPNAPIVKPGGFFTSLYDGQDTQARYKGIADGCGTLPPPPPPPDDGDGDDGETG